MVLPSFFLNHGPYQRVVIGYWLTSNSPGIQWPLPILVIGGDGQIVLY
jgi:hypothetical protein